MGALGPPNVAVLAAFLKLPRLVGPVVKPDPRLASMMYLRFKGRFFHDALTRGFESGPFAARHNVKKLRILTEGLRQTRDVPPDRAQKLREHA